MATSQNINYYFSAQNNENKEQAYIPDVLEGNWYEDRQTWAYENKKKRDFMLQNPNQWMFDTTYNELGQNWKDFQADLTYRKNNNDNFLNFQSKDPNMFITTNKHAMDPKYRHTFRTPLDFHDYYKGKDKELNEYRQSWTKKPQLFNTTYNHDILTKTVKADK